MLSNATKLFAVVLTFATFSGSILRADDAVRMERESAKAWAMHRIAVLQAAAGEFQDAKRTVSQIDDTIPTTPADVTAVRFNNGEIIYCPLPVPVTANRETWQESPRLIRVAQVRTRIPAKVPEGLPSDYLAADPEHGILVAFTDECDSQGTRVTSRTYADGLTVIETPHAGRRVF